VEVEVGREGEWLGKSLKRRKPPPFILRSRKGKKEEEKEEKEGGTTEKASWSGLQVYSWLC